MIETTTPTAVSSMRLLCHVRMFKPQFAPLVESGVKCQTVRPKPKRMPKPGDRISLRMWTGKPYWSKQRVLRESEIVQVQSIWFNGVTILLDDPKGEKGLLPRSVEEAFARADGFENLKAMSDWFEANHGLPFEGIVIKWHNAALCRPADSEAGGQGKDTNEK